jgi:hypothetical protein
MQVQWIISFVMMRIGDIFHNNIRVRSDFPQGSYVGQSFAPASQDSQMKTESQLIDRKGWHWSLGVRICQKW